MSDMVSAEGFIVATLDHDWRFSDVSVGSAALLNWPDDRERGARIQDLVHPLDVPALLAAIGRSAVDQRVATIHLRISGAGGEWLGARMGLSPLCGHSTPRFGLVIWILSDSGEPEPRADRLARLEEHLARIGAEVRAAGISTRSPDTYLIEVADLTARQSEIVRRIVEGQRVGAIARDLFLSPSTVRNHLSAIYRKLGVGSQSELIDRLREQPAPTGTRTTGGGEGGPGV